MFKYIKLLIIKYRINDLIYYFFSKNKFKNKYLNSESQKNETELKKIFDKYSNIINSKNNYSKIWKDIINSFYHELTIIFEKKNYKKFKLIMNSFLSSNVIRGAEDGNLYKNFILRISHKVALIKSIYIISRYLNIINYENPYQPELKKKINIYNLYKKIEKKIPIKNLPNIGSPYGYKWKDSVINYRFLESIYWNLTIKNFLKINNLEKINILEIGAGSGLNPLIFYYFFKKKINNYFLVDIPHILLFQEYFLKNALLEKDEIKKFTFIENSNLDKINNQQINIFLNKDSFPEINDKDAEKYLDFISQNKNSYFFSVNHESKISGQNNLFERLKKYSNIHLIEREDFNIRKGYVKEIYIVK